MGSAQVRVRTHDADRRDTCFLTVMNDSAYASGVVNSFESNCYSALQTIRVAGEGDHFIVHNGGSAEMIAGEKILYLPGTKVEQGGYMHGYISPQGPWCYQTKSAVLTLEPSALTLEPSALNTVYPDGFRVRVWPNPVSDLLNVAWEGRDSSAETQVQLFGLYGNILLNTTIAGSNKMVVTMKNLPGGMYVVKVTQGRGSEVVKVVKK
jgi:hypothetical protein